MRRATLLVLLVAATAVAAAAASPRHARVLLHSSPLGGTMLVDGSGRTLYLFTADRTGKSACLAQCAAAWPPFVTTGAPVAAAGVKQALLKTTKRKDGRMQVVYAGHPLYFFGGDKKAGDVLGEGSGGTWFAVSAKGAKVPPAPASGGGTTTDPGMTTTDPYGGGGGY